MKPIIPPPLFAALIGAAMWILATSTPSMSVSFPAQGWAALIIAGAGLAIDLISVAAFFKRKTTVNPLKPENANALVIDGLYRISRNPMYLGMLLVLIGWGVWLGNIVNIGIITLFVWTVTVMQIKPEEEALREKFGADYEGYCAKVRRWI